MYIGKANVSRVGLTSGVAARCCEHYRAFVCMADRDASLPRYSHIRRALGSVALMPFNWVQSESRGLAIESALIRMLAPRCNGADLEALRAKRA
eukprot:7746457-Pyramimonas_sp.AAC.1